MKKPPKETKKHPTSLFPNGKGYDNKLASVRVAFNQEKQYIFLEDPYYLWRPEELEICEGGAGS